MHLKVVYELMRRTWSVVPFSVTFLTVSPEEYLILCGDFSDSMGKVPLGFYGVHGGCGFGSFNFDGIRILDLCAAANLTNTNAYFIKPDSHRVIYQFGNSCTQVDYILARPSDLKQVQNVKGI